MNLLSTNYLLESIACFLITEVLSVKQEIPTKLPKYQVKWIDLELFYHLILINVYRC